MPGYLRIMMCYALLVLGLAAKSSYAQTDQTDQTLASFTVRTRQSTANETLQLAQRLFSLNIVDDQPNNFNVTESNQRHIVMSSDGTKRLEFDTVSGGIWATDKSVPNFPSNSDLSINSINSSVFIMADTLLNITNLLPQAGPLKLSKRLSGSSLAHECKSANGSGQYTREEYPIDFSANYDVTLLVSGVEFPIVGGGGKIQITFGSGYELKTFQALWREIVDEVPYNLTPKAVADQQFIESTGSLGENLLFNSTIAYYSEPFGSPQDVMLPVYVFNSTSQVQDELVIHRCEIMRGPDGTPETHSPKFLRPRIPHNTHSSDGTIYKAAAEWLGCPYGLTLGQANTDHFMEGIAAATSEWTIKYNHGNEDVRVSDFTNEVESYANSVDILFYTGHANKDGWLANESGESMVSPNWVNYTAVESARDFLGQQELDWLIIAACGPHQHEAFEPGAGNVFDRWRGVFNGLHTMFAYGSPSCDTDDEGYRFTKYATEGNTLIDSWFRTAKEAQNSGVIVTAMWTDGPGGNALNDHLPGYGWVSQDNLGSSQCRWFMWSTT